MALYVPLARWVGALHMEALEQWALVRERRYQLLTAGLACFCMQLLRQVRPTEGQPMCSAPGETNRRTTNVLCAR
jgi:hypothetical protein